MWGECEGSECGGREDVRGGEDDCEGRVGEHVRECDGSECKGEGVKVCLGEGRVCSYCMHAMILHTHSPSA